MDLGDVVATCEIKVNGHSAGILMSPPYKVEISHFLKEGENEIEVLVYSTLANHYQTQPTPYRGDPKAGLIGPISLLILINLKGLYNEIFYIITDFAMLFGICERTKSI